MKILILADSHGYIGNIVEAYENESPDLVLLAGDCGGDIAELQHIYKELNFIAVRGNCDYFQRSIEDELEIKLEDKIILLTHGHLHDVKRGLDTLEKYAEKSNIDIVIFGHTHIPYYEKKKNIAYFNPGSIKDGNYGVIIKDQDKLNFIHKKISEQKK